MATRTETIAAVLAENGAAAPEVDLDTLAARIDAALGADAPAPEVDTGSSTQ